MIVIRINAFTHKLKVLSKQVTSFLITNCVPPAYTLWHWPYTEPSDTFGSP